MHSALEESTVLKLIVVVRYLWKLVHLGFDSCQIPPRSSQFDVQQRDGPHQIPRHRQPLRLEPIAIECNRELVCVVLHVKLMRLGQR